jgi:anti-sigma B factor antagonist
MDVHVLDTAEAPCRIVQPNGQLDIETAHRLERALERLIEAGDVRIVVDLGRLTFCDSIGLSALILAHRLCADKGGYLRLARPNPFLLNLLTVVGVRDSVEVYDSVESACG